MNRGGNHARAGGAFTAIKSALQVFGQFQIGWLVIADPRRASRPPDQQQATQVPWLQSSR